MRESYQKGLAERRAKHPWSFNYILLQSGDAIAYSLKGASTSIRKTIGPTNPRGPIGAPSVLEEAEHCYYFMRHPIDRVLSAWRHFTIALPRDKGITPLEHLGLSKGVPLEQALEQMLDNYNAHWAVQVEEHSYLGRFVPTRVYRFEAIGTLFPQIFGLDLQSHNSTAAYNKAPWATVWENLQAEDLKAEFERNWKPDFDLWHAAGEEYDTDRAEAAAEGARNHCREQHEAARNRRVHPPDQSDAPENGAGPGGEGKRDDGRDHQRSGQRIGLRF